MSFKRRPPFCVAGGERASPLCEGIGHHSQGLSGSEDMLILANILIMQEHQPSGLRTVTSGCRWSLGEPRRARVSPEDTEGLQRPHRTLGRRTQLVEWWGASPQQGWRSARYRVRGDLVEQNLATMQEESTQGQTESTPAFGWPLSSASSGTFYPQAEGWAWVSWNISYWRARLQGLVRGRKLGGQSRGLGGSI